MAWSGQQCRKIVTHKWYYEMFCSFMAVLSASGVGAPFAALHIYYSASFYQRFLHPLRKRDWFMDIEFKLFLFTQEQLWNGLFLAFGSIWGLPGQICTHTFPGSYRWRDPYSFQEWECFVIRVSMTIACWLPYTLSSTSRLLLVFSAHLIFPAQIEQVHECPTQSNDIQMRKATVILATPVRVSTYIAMYTAKLPT